MDYALEYDRMVEQSNKQQEEIARLTKQRDDLVEALTQIFASVPPYRNDGTLTIPEHVTDLATAALASVKDIK